MSNMDAHSRRQAALEAIAAVAAGAKAGSVETEIVDFKEEAGTVNAGGRRPIDSRHEPAAQVGKQDVPALLGVSERRASTVLTEMKRRGKIEPVGAERGRSVRYRLSR